MTRIIIIKFFVTLATFFLLFSVFNLQVVRNNEFLDLSDKNSIRLLPQEGSRGKILDRWGSPIVDTEICYDVMSTLRNPKEVDKLLTDISGLLDTSYEELRKNLNKTSLESFTPATIAKNIEVKKAIALEELKQDLGGIVIQPRPQRAYPYGTLACHIIGYLGEIDRWRLTRLEDYGYKTSDIVGFGGVEEKYDYFLRQEEGGFSVEVDHRGRFVRTLAFRPPQNGKDINLTVDLRIQKIVEEKLGERKGCAIIMDPYTGEIIAMASRPVFDPAAFVKRSNTAIAAFLTDKDAPMMDRAVSSVIPAASVFKLIVASAGLETGKLDLSQYFLCTGSLKIGRRRFKCWSTHGEQNLIGGIIHSCDVYFYNAGIRTGPDNIHDYAVKFGFSKPTGIDLPGEKGGFIPSPLWKRMKKFQPWLDGDTANFSIGQGEVLVTPIQMVRMMAVFANKSYLVTPYIIKAIDGKDISEQQRKMIPLNLKQTTIEYIRAGLRGVVADPEGTAGHLASLKVSVAGKTGTAQVPNGQPHGWFAGFFPYEEPKFVICVFLEHGAAGYVAAVVGKQIIQAMIEQGLV